MSVQVKGSVKYNIFNDNEGNVKTLASWSIPNFMELLKDKNIEEIQSPNQKFRFAATWWFKTENKRVVISFIPTTPIYLKSAELKTLIFDENQWEYEEDHSIARKEHLIISAEKWVSITVLGVDESKSLSVQDNKKMRVCLLNGSLCLKFEFVITTIKTKPYLNIPTIKLKDIFKNIFLEGTYSDVVIKSADGDEFKAHKVLLASQSAVLKANFDHNFTESTTNIIDSPLETDVLHEMLSFIYTDQAKVDEMPEKLLAAADYYQLGRLKSLCEKALYEKLTVDNAVETLQLADLHSTELLTELTLDFINKDYKQLQLVTKTEGWANLNSIDLIKRIFK